MHRNYKIKLFLIISTLIVLSLLILPTKYFKENVTQNFRIYTCQPTFTEYNDSPKLKIARLYYGFINFIKNRCDYEKIKINIDLKSFEKIKNDRKRAINNGIITNPQKISASILHKGQKYKTKIKLKGDLPGHWILNKQWSLRIELENKKSINGMEKFSITKFIERGYPENLIISNQFKRLGLIAPNFKIYKVNINGEDWGLMLAEEHYSEVFYENRKLKDGLIFRLTNEASFFIKKLVLANNIQPNEILIKKQGNLEIDISNAKKINRFPHFKDHETLIKSVNVILNSDKKAEIKYNLVKKYFNIPKLAGLIANSLVFQTSHTLLSNNVRFYLNPYNLKIEPIPTDNNHEKQKLLNKNDYKKYIVNITSDLNFFTLLFEDEIFINEYYKSLLKIKSDLPLIKDDARILCKNFDPFCNKKINFNQIEDRILKLIKLNKDVFPNNELLNSKRNIKTDSINNYLTTHEEHKALKISDTIVYARLFNNYLKVYNLTLETLKLNSINFYYDKIYNSKCKKFKRKDCDFNKIKVNVNLGTSLDEVISKDIEFMRSDNKKIIWAELFGNYKNEDFRYKVKIENDKFDDYNLITELYYTNKHLNNLEGKTYIIDGKFTINEPIIIPKNYNLMIKAGSELFFSQNAYIYLDQGTLVLDGEKKLIKLLPKNKSWGGIYVNNSLEKSIINNTYIEATHNFKHEGIFLTGGINFYKSNIEILNSKIINNQSEDSVNIIKSKFFIKNTLIKNSLSDGLDSDFSIGKIEETIFENIGNDAIDTSGSEIFIKDTKIYNVEDKAISAGEKSKIKIDSILVNLSRYGIVSKDLSNISGTDVTIRNSAIFDFMAFQKKMHYGPGFISINNVKSDNKIIAQKKSIIEINDKEIVSKVFNPN